MGLNSCLFVSVNLRRAYSTIRRSLTATKVIADPDPNPIQKVPTYDYNDAS